MRADKESVTCKTCLKLPPLSAFDLLVNGLVEASLIRQHHDEGDIEGAQHLYNEALAIQIAQRRSRNA